MDEIIQHKYKVYWGNPARQNRLTRGRFVNGDNADASGSNFRALDLGEPDHTLPIYFSSLLGLKLIDTIELTRQIRFNLSNQRIGGLNGTSVLVVVRTIHYDELRYRDRHLIENVFCRLKEFRRVATRYDKLARNFLSAVALATLIAFWI